MASDKFTIQLNIANKLYPITVDRESEEVYRKAAKLIQQKLDRYTSSFYAEDKQDYNAMVMLDLAVSLVSEQNIDDRLQQLVNKLDMIIK
ncbi:MAG: cell division protein ZapA [Bacteroidaceae bacterium]